MRMRSSPFVVLALGLGLVPALGAADALQPDPDRGKRLLREGDALADQGKPNEAVLRYKEAFEDLLPGMRGLRFRHEVKRDVTRRDQMRALVLKEIEEDMTPAEFRANELGMKALGLIPRHYDLKDGMVKVLADEIAAFYDPKTKTMHLIKESDEKPFRSPSLFERMLGKKEGFDKDEHKTVLAHELTHALADQNFDIEAMQKGAEGDDDRSLALSALIEGEATLTMFGAQMSDWRGTQIARVPAERLDRLVGLMGAVVPMAGGSNFRSAPPIVAESMIFPYLRGLVFCAGLTNHGGWGTLDAAYRRPPLSTEQILHPEKYRTRPDPPTALDLGTLDAGSDWKEAGRNVVGEMQLAVLLRGHRGKEAAAGWDGDSFAVFEGPSGRLGLVWLSTWDTEADAREFAEQYTRFQTTKLGAGIPEPDAYPDSIRRPHQGTVFAVERRGPDVAVVEGFPSATTERLLEAAFRARKSEKTATTRSTKPADASRAAAR